MTNPEQPIANTQLRVMMDQIYQTLGTIEIKNHLNFSCVRAGWTLEMVFHNSDTLQVRERAWKLTDFLLKQLARKILFIGTVASQNSY